MKMIYNGTPIKSINVKHYELDTNSATMVPSDLQAGVTAFAKGKKITGTGKSFEFAYYGVIDTNTPTYSPSIINIIEIASIEYPIKLSIALNDMSKIDFSTAQTVGHVIVEGIEYPITAQVDGVVLNLACEKTIPLQFFYGKDNYV